LYLPSFRANATRRTRPGREARYRDDGEIGVKLGSDSIFIVSLRGRYQRPEAGINDENEKTIGRRSNPPNSVHPPNRLLVFYVDAGVATER
jgi:hypothetical protein